MRTLCTLAALGACASAAWGQAPLVVPAALSDAPPLAGPGMAPPPGMGGFPSNGLVAGPGMPPGMGGPMMGGPPPGMPGGPMMGGPPPGAPGGMPTPFGTMPGPFGPGWGMGGPPEPTFDGCDACTTCAFGGAEYLLFFPRRGPIRFPLVTSSGPGARGILGQSSTLVEIGDDDVNYGTMSGVRANAGFWKGLNRRIGFELGGFIMERSVEREVFASDETGFPVVARPFINQGTVPGAEPTRDALLVSFPNAINGGVVVTNALFIWSAEANALLNIYRASLPDCKVRNLNMIAGFRHFNFNERLQISSQSDVFGADTFFGGFPQDANAFDGGGNQFVVSVLDDIAVRNEFYGGQLGGQLDMQHKCWTFSVIGKMGVGYLREIYRLNGVSTQVGGTQAGFFSRSVPGGLFVTSSNLGKFDTQEVAILPEGQFRVGWQVCKNVNLYAGYSLLYLNRVGRPGNQIDPVVDPRLVPTNALYSNAVDPPRPGLPMIQDEFFLQGATFGVQVAF